MSARLTYSYWASIRIVQGRSHEEAVRNVIRGEFIESHPMCDKVLPLKDKDEDKQRSKG